MFSGGHDPAVPGPDESRKQGEQIMTGVNRREFMSRGIRLGAGLAGAGALGGALILPEESQAAQIKFIQTRCGRPGAAGGRVLVAYASRCGSTGGVAEAIGRELCQAGAQADVRLVNEVADLSPYRAVIVGSAVWRGHWLDEAVEFVTKNKKFLAGRPTAYFLTCIALSYPNDMTRRLARGWMNTVLREVPEVKPRDLGMFAGAVDYAKLSPEIRELLRKKLQEKHIKPGDYRDWAVIRNWARGLRARLDLKAGGSRAEGRG
jgi:menaquinone-dependent protoporphyrinogen oxidase